MKTGTVNISHLDISDPLGLASAPSRSSGPTGRAKIGDPSRANFSRLREPCLVGGRPPYAMLSWYVATTEAFCEARAEEGIERKRIGVQTFNPKCVTTKFIRGRKQMTEMPYLPGYIFVRFDRGDDRWRGIYAVRGIRTILGATPERPSPIRDDAMAILLDRCNGQYVEAKHVDTALSKIIPIGSTVQITRGAFSGYEAEVSWSHGDRVKVIMSLLGAQREIKLSSHDVRMVA